MTLSPILSRSEMSWVSEKNNKKRNWNLEGKIFLLVIFREWEWRGVFKEENKNHYYRGLTLSVQRLQREREGTGERVREMMGTDMVGQTCWRLFLGCLLAILHRRWVNRVRDLLNAFIFCFYFFLKKIFFIIYIYIYIYTQ